MFEFPEGINELHPLTQEGIEVSTTYWVSMTDSDEEMPRIGLQHRVENPL